MKNARSIIETFAQELATAADLAWTNERLLEYLSFCSRFHRYSFHNTMLIFSQCPEATRVAGFHAWKKMGRFVMKGEKGILILAPVTVKEESESGEEKAVTRFRGVYVFDVSQTEGDALPADPMISRDACPEELILRLESFAREHDITLVSDRIPGAYGASAGGKVYIDPALQGADRFAVLVHELAHELLHQEQRPDRLVREVQAETVAYSVCCHFGVTSTAPAYLALQGAKSEDILAQIEPIVNVTQRLVSYLESIQQVSQATAV